jgi:adenosylmethionine-8-amino-7-oxononanoate aminotransferase
MAPTAFLHPFARPASDDFITIVRGEGAAVFDDTGRRYVDGMASLWYCNVGHARREIADAVGRQLAVLDDYNTFDVFTNRPAEDVAATIAALAPVPDARVFLTCSGSEAVDTALKLARLTHHLNGEPDRRIVVGRHNAYHGVTYGGVSVQGLPLNKEGWGPLLPDVHHVDPHEIDEAEALFTQYGDRIAAFIAEPVIGAGGVFPPTEGYLHGLRKLCDAHGALLIFDEVITAFGRLGAWFASEHYGVTPDLITFAKAVSSGYQPLGGVVVGPQVRRALEADPDFVLRHGFTYSGHPAACVAGSENIRILRDERLLERAGPIGEVLGVGLRRMVDDGLIAEARGEGAIWAAGMLPEVSALDVRAGLLERGVIARPIGAATIAFCPPLVIGEDDLARCLSALGESLRSVRARS